MNRGPVHTSNFGTLYKRLLLQNSSSFCKDPLSYLYIYILYILYGTYYFYSKRTGVPFLLGNIKH